ncbi:hypothetical protein PybrP1_008068 [[Pythium] brassicae (nom. inval.)]|nr:hypothetical protein PybrP1_008068 [[Pythium] brassicae (nom. inval.)]
MSVVEKALRGGSYVLVQRAFTFALNALVLRKLQLSVTGAAAVRLELALASIFLLRDGFRLAFLRMPSLDQAPSSASRALVQQLVNVAWLSTAFSWLVALAIAAFSLRSAGGAAEPNTAAATDGLADYTRVLVMYCAAAALEALAEPMFVLAHCSVLVSWQVAAQSAGFVARALVQYACIFALDLGLLAYGFAELAYASALLCVFAGLFWRRIYAREPPPGQPGFALTSMADLLPHAPRASDAHAGHWFHPQLCALLVPLGLQSGVKYLLTEGDKWVLSLFASFQNMGVYGIVFHLGSLVPRIVFLPIEEATKTIFSKMASHRAESSDSSSSSSQAPSAHDGFHLVLVLLKLMHVVGFVFACFGVNYAHTLVLLLYGAEKARLGVSDALAVYCVYILFLGLNGICEAFVHAVGSAAQLMRLNKLMAGFFVLYAASAALFMSALQLGTPGIVLANCVNMGCRILYCLSFMAAHFVGGKDAARGLIAFWRQSLPHRAVLLAFGVSFAVTSASSRLLLGGAHSESWPRHALHVAIGAACFAGVALALYAKERRLLLEQLAVLRRSNRQPQQKPHEE